METRYQSKEIYKNLYFLEGNEVIPYDFEKIKRLYEIDTVIKLLSEDFQFINPRHKRLTHFNIQHAGHYVGKYYLVLKIEKPGFFNKIKELPPILSMKGALIAKCISIRNEVQYEELLKKDFINSLNHIKDTSELKFAILRRYKNSLAHLNERQKLALGISITELEFIGEASEGLMASIEFEGGNDSNIYRT